MIRAGGNVTLAIKHYSITTVIYMECNKFNANVTET